MCAWAPPPLRRRAASTTGVAPVSVLAEVMHGLFAVRLLPNPQRRSENGKQAKVFVRLGIAAGRPRAANKTVRKPLRHIVL